MVVYRLPTAWRNVHTFVFAPFSFSVVALSSTVVSLRFERSMYSTPEGMAVELCLIAEGMNNTGGIDSPFTARVESADMTATGK